VRALLLLLALVLPVGALAKPAGPCLISPGSDPTHAVLWPGCGVDAPLMNQAGRCIEGPRCMKPCRTEVLEPGKAPRVISRYQYDKVGRLIEERSFDEAGRLEPKQTLRCEYGGGRLMGCSYGGKPWKLTYDAAGRLTRLDLSASEGRTWVATYSYGPGGEIRERSLETEQEDPIVIAYGYDKAKRLVTEKEGSATTPSETTSYEYDPTGQLVRAARPHFRFELAYDDYGHPSSMIEKSPSGIEHVRYRYDDAHRLVLEERSAEALGPARRSIRHVYECRAR